MSSSFALRLTLPCIQQMPEEQLRKSLYLRITVAVLGILALITGALLLADLPLSFLNHFGTTQPGIIISSSLIVGGAFLIVGSLCLKCVRTQYATPPQTKEGPKSETLPTADTKPSSSILSNNDLEIHVENNQIIFDDTHQKKFVVITKDSQSAKDALNRIKKEKLMSEIKNRMQSPSPQESLEALFNKTEPLKNQSAANPPHFDCVVENQSVSLTNDTLSLTFFMRDYDAQCLFKTS